MKQIAAAALAVLHSSFAVATHNCFPGDTLKKSWEMINTDQIFQGLADDGTLTTVYENIDTGRWSIVYQDTNGTMCYMDMGGGADSLRMPFTRVDKSKPAAHVPGP